MQEVKNDVQGLKTDVQAITSDMEELKSEMHDRFDKVDAKLVGVGNQFEFTNESRIVEDGFISDKVNKLEKEIYLIKNKINS
ncbi:hypothetical protein Q73_13780 [Bacillus coahuilensis m2-6]|uniref:Uncharacterized protein n=2 Tax=Bacillus coahuilensis TaxID=408580 RepID=A0A147K4E6_9BACI|nr:hypothetical protein [Bacillus coahuilensis]KUP04195.1 hypothetical protein Q75_16380 [Bacillus coahuilensis p1.1.43]KUP05092.1 hypothetical protein Q73_13780 [Bacillus coahuilensis m2-6]